MLELIFEKTVEIEVATLGDTAAYIVVMAATYRAYSSMSWPLVSFQILKDQIALMRRSVTTLSVRDQCDSTVISPSTSKITSNFGILTLVES
jgi:hypothetical protein